MFSVKLSTAVVDAKWHNLCFLLLLPAFSPISRTMSVSLLYDLVNGFLYYFVSFVHIIPRLSINTVQRYEQFFVHTIDEPLIKVNKFHKSKKHTYLCSENLIIIWI